MILGLLYADNCSHLIRLTLKKVVSDPSAETSHTFCFTISIKKMEMLHQKATSEDSPALTSALMAITIEYFNYLGNVNNLCHVTQQ